MQVTSSSYSYGHTNPTTQNNNNKQTDDFLFEEGQKQSIVVQADVSKPIEPGSTPTIIGALLSTFADEVINFLGGDSVGDVEPSDDRTDEKVPAASGSSNANFIA